VPSAASGGGGSAAGGMAGSGGAAAGALGGAGGEPAASGSAGLGGTAGAAPGGGSGSGGVVGQAGAAGSAGGASLLELARAFHGFRMDLGCDHYQEQPCEPQNSAMPNRGYLCCFVDTTIERENRPPIDEELSFGGDPAKTYAVTLRVRGVIENRDYGGQGIERGDWVLEGGSLPQPSAIHVFGATVQSPHETYFFNSWNDTAEPARIIAVDYQVTLPMRGGTQVRLFEYDDIGKIWANAEGLKVPELAPYPAAFDGQFLRLDVVSVTESQ
jgi:hypothetical protein